MQMSEVIAAARSERKNRGNNRKELYFHQKMMLETMLNHGAISKEQFNESLTCLRKKMLPLDESLPQ